MDLPGALADIVRYRFDADVAEPVRYPWLVHLASAHGFGGLGLVPVAVPDGLRLAGVQFSV